MSDPALHDLPIAPPDPPKPPRRSTRPPVPTAPQTRPPSWPIVLLLLASAVAFELIWRSTASSALSVVVVGGVAVSILTSPSRRRVRVMLPLLLALLLSFNLAFRASPWVVGPTVVASVCLLLMGSQDRWRASSPFVLGMTIIRGIESTLQMPRWLVGPVIDAGENRQQRMALLRGAAVAAIITAALTSLLASADAVFGSLLGGIGGHTSHAVLTIPCLVTIGGLAVSARMERPLPLLVVPQVSASVEGFMGMAAMVGVLGVWCVIQAVVALGGADWVLAAEDLTRAEYARSGFFELVAVIGVVLTLLSLLDHITLRSSRRSARVFSALGSVVVVETCILVVATYRRLDLYIDAFGLTMLRLSVAWFLGFLLAMLGFLCLRMYGVGRGRTETTILLLAAMATLGFGWSNPEAVVTGVNATQTTAALDVDYLTTLSADNHLELAELMVELETAGRADEASRVRGHLCSYRDAEHSSRYGPLNWNLARSRAGDSRAALDCQP